MFLTDKHWLYDNICQNYIQQVRDKINQLFEPLDTLFLYLETFISNAPSVIKIFVLLLPRCKYRPPENTICGVTAKDTFSETFFVVRYLETKQKSFFLLQNYLKRSVNIYVYVHYSVLAGKVWKHSM